MRSTSVQREPRRYFDDDSKKGVDRDIPDVRKKVRVSASSSVETSKRQYGTISPFGRNVGKRKEGRCSSTREQAIQEDRQTEWILYFWGCRGRGECGRRC